VKKLPKAEHYLALRISLFNLFKGKRKNATTNIYLFLFYLFFHLGIFHDCLKKGSLLSKLIIKNYKII
jgi:hypothetical protein